MAEFEKKEQWYFDTTTNYTGTINWMADLILTPSTNTIFFWNQTSPQEVLIDYDPATLKLKIEEMVEDIIKTQIQAGGYDTEGTRNQARRWVYGELEKVAQLQWTMDWLRHGFKKGENPDGNKKTY